MLIFTRAQIILSLILNTFDRHLLELTNVTLMSTYCSIVNRIYSSTFGLNGCFNSGTCTHSNSSYLTTAVCD